MLHPGTVQIPAHYFEAIIREIVGNAFKFSEKGDSIKINTSSRHNYLDIEISDEGIGMPKEQIDSINLFSQHERHKHEQQGLGMGLALVAKILEVFQGELCIKSHEKCRHLSIHPVSKSLTYLSKALDLNLNSPAM